MSLADIKDRAKRRVLGIEFSMFIPLFVIGIVSTAVSSTFIGAIFVPAFDYVASIFVYGFLKTGQRDFNALVNDYRNFDNVATVLKCGLRFFLYTLAASLVTIVLMLISLAFQNSWVMLILIAVSCIITIVISLYLKFRFFYVPYIIKDADFRITSKEAFDLSSLMSYGNRMTIFELQLRFILEWLLCIITLGIYSIWLVPRLQTANAMLYEEIKEKYLATSHDRLADLIRVVEPEPKTDEFASVEDEFENNVFHKTEPFEEENKSENSDPFDM